jgi:pseudouridine synthase
MAKVRLQKYLSQLGVASRREAEDWIREGRVKLNGKIVTELGTKIDVETDRLLVNGKSLKTDLPPKVYWLLNKPDKILTSRSSNESGKPTIYDLPKLSRAKFLVSPVGRLDFRTEGLLLLTNDGELANRLCKPEFHVPREYQVLVNERLTDEQESEFRRGIKLEDGLVKNVEIKYVHSAKLGVSKGYWYVVTVHEGRNRLVRRMFSHFERRVIRLIRIGFGEIRLTPELDVGDYRQLTAKEIAGLKQSAQL